MGYPYNGLKIVNFINKKLHWSGENMFCKKFQNSKVTKVSQSQNTFAFPFASFQK